MINVISYNATAITPHATKHAACIHEWAESAHKISTGPANHNLTRQAREGNVIPLGGHYVPDDYRPDLGARLALVS
ncbi:hypothetical protein EDD53_2730 [Pacificibacter maritimus]|uniref:Uncharacterized protein n=1 Tax=Pacificibacter maritimus TaxID=762213 RepID=A0A3N4TX57_9RHOB|nr:hypothetical protein [Pacificibacter maritimus]RPE63133.1 hypothetical protein EDD53_2730 [Pacificibacter maritimus]